MIEAVMIDFETLKRPSSPNTYLVCDADVCAAEADREAPSFYRSPEDVRDALLSVIEAQPRTTAAGSDPAVMKYAFVQRTAVLRFKDDVTVQVAPAPGGGARVFAYSASRVGYSDLGTNKRRIDSWLDALAEELAR